MGANDLENRRHWLVAGEGSNPDPPPYLESLL